MSTTYSSTPTDCEEANIYAPSPTRFALPCGTSEVSLQIIDLLAMVTYVYMYVKLHFTLLGKSTTRTLPELFDAVAVHMERAARLLVDPTCFFLFGVHHNISPYFSIFLKISCEFF